MTPLVKHTIFMCWWLKIAVTGTTSLQGNRYFWVFPIWKNKVEIRTRTETFHNPFFYRNVFISCTKITAC